MPCADPENFLSGGGGGGPNSQKGSEMGVRSDSLTF